MNKIIHLLYGAAVVPALLLIYMLLLRHEQSILSPPQWLVLGGVSFVLMLAAFLPDIIRRSRGLPPHPVSPSDLRFMIALTMVLCPLTFFAVFAFGAFGSLVIMLVPLAFVFRYGDRSLPTPDKRNP